MRDVLSERLSEATFVTDVDNTLLFLERLRLTIMLRGAVPVRYA